jgi:hypothetical protein
MVEWWNGGMVEWWNGGMVEWWNGGMVEYGDKLLTVGASVKLWKVSELNEKRGVTLLSMGYCLAYGQSQTVGGIAATNVHHTGMPDFKHAIDSIKVAIFDSNGVPKHVVAKNGSELFNASVGGIGTCGIITSVTLRLQPLRYYRNLSESRRNAFLGLPHLLESFLNEQYPKTQRLDGSRVAQYSTNGVDIVTDVSVVTPLSSGHGDTNNVIRLFTTTIR